MHAKGLIECPPKRLKPRNKKGANARKNKIKFTEPDRIKNGQAGEYQDLYFELVRGCKAHKKYMAMGKGL